MRGSETTLLIGSNYLLSDTYAPPIYPQSKISLVHMPVTLDRPMYLHPGIPGLSPVVMFGQCISEVDISTYHSFKLW